MDIIKSYLDSMFAGLPNVPEVWRAKDELWQMMEDKYNELIEEGISENEAIGTVIAEFGNLDELAEDLGINTVIENTEIPSGPVLPLEKVKQMLQDQTRMLFLKSLGVFFFIICVTGPILAGGLEDSGVIGESAIAFGVLAMFLFIGVGIGLCIYSGVAGSKWKYVRKEGWRIDRTTAEYISGQRENFRGTHAVMKAVGIVFCAMCFVPISVVGGLGVENEVILCIFTDFMFLFIGIGVMMILNAGKMRLLNRILELNDRTTVGGNYVRDQQEETYSNPVVGTVMSVYWQTVTCIYLTISFLTYHWEATWIIWPVAAVICTIIKNLYLEKNENSRGYAG